MKKNFNLYIYFGPMFSGKSKKLIEVFESFEDKKAIFKPKQDTRFYDFVISRDGEKTKAIVLDNISEIYDYLKNKDIKDIFFDEAFMFKGEIFDTISNLLKKEYRLHIATLDKNYLGKKFSQIEKLISIAPKSNQHRLFARCHICNMPSNWTIRLINGKIDNDKKSPEIVIDNFKTNYVYETRCDKHHFFEYFSKEEENGAIFKISEENS